MKWYTHTACTTLLTLVLNPAWTPLAALGSVLPDVFERMIGARHRSLHELMLWLTFLPLLATPYAGLALGSIHHILLDALTIYGVTIIGKRVKGPFNTNRAPDNIAVILLHMPVLLLTGV